MKRRSWIMLTTLLATASVLLASRDAEACGGTFCDAGPTAMPVDQTGENILFVMGDGYTEAHIQIQYDPDAEASEFAWIVPMTAVPSFSVGSQPLFDAVLGSTVPAYGFNYQFDSCGDVSLSSSGGSTDPSGDTAADTGGESDSDTGPTVVLQETVGAFEITVLEGGTAAEVMDWLGANNYQQDPNAEPILAEYLAENYVFAAFRLTNGAETAEIHPVTLRFDLEEACVPIRLTRIAAVENMAIRSFFLADARVVPQTYKHVVVNPLKLDWPNQAANYTDVITMAVDAFGADGKAFVTEYAGASTIVPRFSLHNEQWSASAFEGLPVIDVVDQLESQGFGFCDEFEGCFWSHGLVAGLLASYVPVPEGVDPAAFYACLSCYEEMIDVDAYGDGAAFAAAFAERIVAPGVHANEILDGFDTLTRMFTTISPAEMTADPFFWENASLPDVDLTQSVATRRVLCNGDALWTLPDGREVYVPNDGAWPAFEDEMPWEQEVSEMPNNGAPIAIVDNIASIDTQLATYNCSVGWPANTCGGAADGTGSASGTASASGESGDADGSSGSSGAGAEGERGGCGCATAASRASALWGLVAIAWRRRQRPSKVRT